MPFQSQKQRRYLWANRPDIAARWTAEQKAKGEAVVKKTKTKKKPKY